MLFDEVPRGVEKVRNTQETSKACIIAHDCFKYFHTQANVGNVCTGSEVPTVVMFVLPVARSNPFLLQDWGDYLQDDLNFGWQCRRDLALSGRSENIDFDQHLIFLLRLPRLPMYAHGTKGSEFQVAYSSPHHILSDSRNVFVDYCNPSRFTA